MAQLDQLGQAKEVAQHASAIGQEFSPGLLAKIATKSLDELTPELNRLIDLKNRRAECPHIRRISF